MEGGDGAGDGDLRHPGVERREQHQKPLLPLDMVLEVAARSDPATLVRCAATCRDARRRVADDQSFHRRLRLRHGADGRFVPSLLRDHLVVLERYNSSRILTGIEVHLVDATAAAGTGARSRRLSSAEGFPPHPDDGKSIMWHKPLAWRDGLFLVRTSDRPRGKCDDELRVCDPATGRSQTLPPDPTFHGDAERRSQSRCWWSSKASRWQPYVLLDGDGDGDVGGGDDACGIIRPFQVLKANLVMSEHHRYMETQTFSSESSKWGTYAKLRAPHFHGSSLLLRDGGRPLVVGGAVHWLCITDAASYVLRLHVRTAQVTVTTLPASFPRPTNDYMTRVEYLLATATAGGSLMVLVADREKISAWVQTATKPTTKWKARPEVVVEYEEFLRFRNIAWSQTYSVRLLWFAERSGLVLVYAGVAYGFFLMDLRSKKIVRWFSGRHLKPFETIFAPYEMDLSSWVPTFTSTF